MQNVDQQNKNRHYIDNIILRMIFSLNMHLKASAIYRQIFI